MLHSSLFVKYLTTLCLALLNIHEVLSPATKGAHQCSIVLLKFTKVSLSQNKILWLWIFLSVPTAVIFLLNYDLRSEVTPSRRISICANLDSLVRVSLSAKAWSSTVEWDEGCIGRSSKLLCLWQTQNKLCCTCMATFHTVWLDRPNLVAHRLLIKCHTTKAIRFTKNSYLLVILSNSTCR